MITPPVSIYMIIRILGKNVIYYSLWIAVILGINILRVAYKQ